MSHRISMDSGWKFFLGDLSPKDPAEGWGGAKARAYSFGAVSETLKDDKWRTVDLPHDFVVEGDYTQKISRDSGMRKIPEMESMDSRHFAGGSLEGGVAWYRKRFYLPRGCCGKRIYIHFGGVYRDSTVYLNEYYVGRYASGYSSFYYDITDFVNIDGENLIAVRVDASGREGWWYEGGGIYRHVWLEVKEDTAVGQDGVFICSEVDLEKNSALLSIRTEVENKRLCSAAVTVEQSVCDAYGKEIASVSGDITAEAWDKAVCSQEIILNNAELWDIEHPYMYSLRTNIYAGGILTDTVMTGFGIRDIRFDAGTGFYLNGRNVRLKGLCCHQDHAGVGIAADESIWEYRMRQMKGMGMNAYRSAHHMMTKELLDICDRLGILVFDETRRMSSAKEDIDALRTMVLTGRNHPSVFLWGIGNEEIFSQHRQETARTTMTMKAEIKKLDPTRAVTSAVVCWNGSERFDNAAGYVSVTKHLDVMGFNYCKTAWDDYRKRVPAQPIIITEASSNSGTRGCYSTNEALGHYYILDPQNGVKCKNPQKAVRKDLGESEWKYFAERGYLAGIFIWTGMDYRGEPTPLVYPAVYSQFGIFDYCGFPKDNYYYYKSWWTDEPVLHIFPHWNFADKVGEKVNVYCYSNLEEIELFVNGKSLGKKKIERNWYQVWEGVVYEPGEIKAVGLKGGSGVMTETVCTTGAPYRIELAPYKTKISKNETAIVNIRVTDEKGLIVPDADNEITFKVCGGKMIGTGNGDPGSHESDKRPVRRAFNGLCQILVRASDSGEIKITAESSGMRKGICSVFAK